MVAQFDLYGTLINAHILDTTTLEGDNEYGASLTIDEEGSIYTTGIAYSQEMRLTEGGGDFYIINDGAIYVTKLDALLQEQSALLIIDGFYNDTVCDIALNASGFVHITGHTESINYPRVDSLEEFSGGFDSFLTIAHPNNLSVVHSSLSGGVDDETGTYIVFDSLERIVLCGTTNSIDLLPVNAFQSSKSDGGYGFDGYVWCLDLSLRTTPIVVEPIQIDIDVSLIVVGFAPSLIAIVFFFIISRRMKKNKEVNSEGTTPE
jgi:hypothetical protein